MKKIAIVLTLAGVLGFFATSLVQSAPPPGPPPGDSKGTSDIPIWQITVNGGVAVEWVDHEPNKRFAIYDPDPLVGDPTDDVVLDKETGLVWQRSPSEQFTTWTNAWRGAHNIFFGGRKGWRLPTIEELNSLVDTTNNSPSLPDGHPFVNVTYEFWTSTIDPNDINPHRWVVYFQDGAAAALVVGEPHKAWYVRGGSDISISNLF